MPGPNDNYNDDDDNELHGPSQADIERYGDDRYEERAGLRGPAPGRLWKLVAGVTFIAFALALVLNVLLPALSNGETPTDNPDRVDAVVVATIDARTIRVDIDGSEYIVRYIGVDTPNAGEPYHQVGITANEQWTLNKSVSLEADERDTDLEGRLLRYVWLDGEMVNLVMVASGFAAAEDDSRNTRYRDAFMRAESNARSSQFGIWSEGADESVMSVTGDASPT